MSGIVALLRLDGGPAGPHLLASALSEMALRGPEGETVLADGPAVFGHRMLATTPEALFEPMPFRDPHSGCMITADARIDNRETLLPQLGLDDAGREVGDGELILRAWQRWGADCPARLLGDFAFAIWDPRERRIFAARDQMGMRQLIYAHRPGRRFVCSSSTRATVLASGEAPRLNELRIAEALIEFEDSDETSTFYEGVFRLPPGHSLTMDDRGLSISRYWQLEPADPLHLPCDDDYAEALREVLGKAVQSRMRCAGPIGSMLSGGMDSGSIVALAAEALAGVGPLRTFSVLGPDPDSCVETRAIEAALTLPNIAPTRVDYSDLSEWQDPLLAAWHGLEEPFDFHMTLPRATYLAAQRTGTKVLLDGAGGDVMLGEADQMVRRLRAGQWLTAWRDAKGLHAFWGEGTGSAARQVYWAARGAFLPDALRRAKRRWRAMSPAAALPFGAIDSGFARRTGLMDRVRQSELARPIGPESFAEARARIVRTSGLVAARERYDRVAARFGVEPRDPFLDLSVVRFCLSLPPDQLQAGGWPKMVLRRAMTGRLPEGVLWRRGKEHLGWNTTTTLLSRWETWQEPIERQRSALNGRVAETALRPEALRRPGSNNHSEATEHVLALALFLANALQKQA